MSLLYLNSLECLHCKNMLVKPQNPPVSDLPKERFANKEPFSKTEIDYFGPIYLKTLKRTPPLKGNSKGYGGTAHV